MRINFSKCFNKRHWAFFFVISTSLILETTVAVYAAPVNYASNTTVSLTSPAVNFTIRTGAVADSVTINATNITVTMSTSTGGTFALESSARNISVSADSEGGTLVMGCSAGTASVVISQIGASSTYTITPLPDQCVEQVSSQSGSGIQTNPVSSNVTNTNTSAASTSTIPSIVPDISSLQAQIEVLKTTLRNLVTQAKEAGIPVPPAVESYIGAVSVFTKNLTFGSKGDDVAAVQSFLITKNSGQAAERLSRVGATGFFGTLTREAVREYQNLSGLPATGYFGPQTRARINSLNQQ